MRNHNEPFYWKCGYMGGTDFIERSTGRRIELHRDLSVYHRSTLNPDYIATRDQLTGCITVSGQEMDVAFLDNFNQWRIETHKAHIADMKTQPHRYGPADELDREFPTPLPVRGAYWADGQLHFIEPSIERSAA